MENKKAIVIGAYGGEHVGDAAILGGVCLRIHARYGISKFCVLSFRPHRTKRWVRELQLPYSFEIVEYSINNIKTELKNSSLLVFGGGPIMDLPFHLSKHLFTVYQAKVYGLSFVIEGCGIGPLNSQISKYLAQKLVNAADEITIRTSISAEHAILSNQRVGIVDDPAFDYLMTRETFTLLPDEAVFYKKLMKDSKGTKILINLRPLWKKYFINQPNIDIHEFQLNFEASFIRALQLLAEYYHDDVTFIFFPMNSDQLGFSDLQVAYRIEEALPDRLDFRVLEYEPGIDFLLYMIKKADLAITMRFHASIFAMFQKIPTFGIGYSVGRSGKVGELFFDQNAQQNFVGVEDFSPSWIVDRVKSLNVGEK